MKEVLDFFNQVKNIEYGWHDKEGNIHKTLKEHKEKFILQDNDTILIKSSLGMNFIEIYNGIKEI